LNPPPPPRQAVQSSPTVDPSPPDVLPAGEVLEQAHEAAATIAAVIKGRGRPPKKAGAPQPSPIPQPIPQPIPAHAAVSPPLRDADLAAAEVPAPECADPSSSNGRLLIPRGLSAAAAVRRHQHSVDAADHDRVQAAAAAEEEEEEEEEEELAVGLGAVKRVRFHNHMQVHSEQQPGGVVVPLPGAMASAHRGRAGRGGSGRGRGYVTRQHMRGDGGMSVISAVSPGSAVLPGSGGVVPSGIEAGRQDQQPRCLRRISGSRRGRDDGRLQALDDGGARRDDVLGFVGSATAPGTHRSSRGAAGKHC
jgi:hypothetical protein